MAFSEARSRRRLEGVYNARHRLLWVLAADGTVVDVNRTALEFADVGPHQALGLPLWSTPWWSGAGNAAARSRIETAVASAAQGRLVIGRLIWQQPRRRLHLQLTLSPIDDGDEGELLCEALLLESLPLAHEDTRSDERLDRIASALDGALARGEFELHFQPVIDLTRTCPAGAEALLRWHHPELGRVSPAEFIPVAEATGAIVPIGIWLLEDALKQLKLYRAMHPDFFLGVNLSPKQLETDAFFQAVVEVVRSARVEPHSLVLELTETYVMQRIEERGEQLGHLAELGVGIAIDDFGTGYSSLSYLQHLPITHVKIDRAFMRGVPEDERSTTLVRAIFALAVTLELEIVAEGIEEVSQEHFLRELGCRLGQGFLYHKAMPERLFSSYLAQQSTR